MSLITMLILSISILCSRMASFSGVPVPIPPAPAQSWDWTNDDSFSSYGSPWDPASSNFGTIVGERDLPKDGWILYDRRLFVGDRNIISGQTVPGAGSLYFILYNKFSGVLRLFYLSSDPLAPSTGVYASLKVTDGGTRISSQSGVPLQMGLFNSGTNDGYSYALDGSAPAIVKKAYAPPSSSGGSGNPWWVFDFQIDYDPNSAGERRYFSIDIRAVSSSSITLNGQLSSTLYSISTNRDLGMMMIPLALGFQALNMVAPTIISKSFGLMFNGFSDGGVLGELLRDNKDEISKEIAKKMVAGGVGFAQSLVAKTETSLQAASFLEGNFNASGDFTTDYSTGAAAVGLFDPEFPSSDLYAPIISKNSGSYPELQRLGLLGVKRVPKVWVYTGWSHITNEGYVFAGANTMAFVPNVHKFKVEDPFCADLVAVNPGSDNLLYDVSTAVSELNWNSVTKISTDNFYFSSLERKVTAFSSSEWENAWPGTFTSSYSTKSAGPLAPHVTQLKFHDKDGAVSAAGFDDGGEYWKAVDRVDPLKPASMWRSSYLFKDRGGKTPDGALYSQQVPLAVSLLAKMISPVGSQDVLVTLPVKNVVYVSDLAAFNSIDIGNGCGKRENVAKRSPNFVYTSHL